jgi:hypothetical protein
MRFDNRVAVSWDGMWFEGRLLLREGERETREANGEKKRRRNNFGVRAIEEIGAETKKELHGRKCESQCLKRIEIQNGILIHRLGWAAFGGC